MFERYTEKARRVIFFARYEASQFGTPAIEPEHLLLGMLREDRTLLRRFFSRAITTESLRREIEGRTLVREKTSTSVELPLAPETKRVLTYAHEESDRLQHRHIGTEHLLLGLLREDRSMAAEILYERGLRLSAVRQEIAGQREALTAGALQSQIDGWLYEIDLEGQRLLTQGARLKTLATNLREHLAGAAPEQRGADSVEAIEEELAGRPEESEASFGARFQRGGRAVMKSVGYRTVLGLEKLLSERVGLLKGARVGLICNQASVDHGLRHAADLFREHDEINLTALFGPQHGIRGDVQDNMEETPHATDKATGLPVYSLYSETREPTEEMMEKVDLLVFDMQDVGCRIYTFIYTLANCMRAAAKYGKRVIVCDRPNPINGIGVAGTVLEPAYASFVGQFPLATRHGMTVCELARMFREHFGIECELETLSMDGWSREQWMDETDAPWVMPSPNMPTLDAATLFPGTVHVEGTQLSEGRGTTRPFELVGAPYIDALEYARQLNGLKLAGLYFRACGFQPTFQKHAKKSCGGVQIHVTSREEFEPVSAGVATVKVARDLYADQFRWKEDPYEYVFDKNPFDVISGTGKLREALERGDTLDNIVASWEAPLKEFKRIRETCLCY